MNQTFGRIYGGNNPTHGVYTQESLKNWGERAVAISHHWTAAAADEAANKETAGRGVPCVTVKYTIVDGSDMEKHH